MKKLFIKIILFSLPILALSIVVEHILRKIPNDFQSKAEQYEKHAGDFKVLCLGESHAYSGIDPRYLDRRGFNGSHFSQTLNYDLEILKKYASDLKNLEYLLLPVSYGSFTSRLENQWEVKNYTLYYNIRGNHNIRYNTELLSLPLESSKEKLISYYMDHIEMTKTDSLGYSTYYNKENPDKNLVELGKKMAVAQTGKNFDNVSKNVKSLEEIIKLCGRKNITLILFTTPGHKEYRKHLDSRQLNTMLTLSKSFARKNRNVHYLNLLEDSSFIAADFYDADHFSSAGAKKLTAKLNRFINEIDVSDKRKTARMSVFGSP